MQFKNLAISAFAATALAQSASESADLVSIFNVLQTALPSSLVAEALTNSAAVSSQIASQFAAGATPSWFTALPSDVQTYLVPAALPTGSIIGGNGTSNGTIGGNNSTSNSTTTARTSTRSTATITSDDSTATAGSGNSDSTSGAGFQGSSSSESGNAAAPTAIIGAGLAGAVGFVGLLAL